MKIKHIIFSFIIGFAISAAVATFKGYLPIGCCVIGITSGTVTACTYALFKECVTPYWNKIRVIIGWD